MKNPELQVIRFANEDVIATSDVFPTDTAYHLTAGQSYVTTYDEFIEGGGSYDWEYAFLRFLYNPGEDNHLTVYGAFGSNSSKECKTRAFGRF